MNFYVKKLEVNALGLGYILSKIEGKESVLLSVVRSDSFLISLSKGTLLDKDCQDEYSRISIKILERYEDNPILELGEGPGDVLKFILQNRQTRIRAVLLKNGPRKVPYFRVLSFGEDSNIYCDMISASQSHLDYAIIYLTNDTVLKLGTDSNWLTYGKDYTLGIDELLTYFESL